MNLDSIIGQPVTIRQVGPSGTGWQLVTSGTLADTGRDEDGPCFDVIETDGRESRFHTTLGYRADFG